jgi:hypothetical protein
VKNTFSLFFEVKNSRGEIYGKQLDTDSRKWHILLRIQVRAYFTAYNEPYHKGKVMLTRFAMRITQDLLNLGAQFTGAEAEEGVFDLVPYLIITPVSPTEFNLKLMTEDQMLTEFKNDSKLQILN